LGSGASVNVLDEVGRRMIKVWRGKRCEGFESRVMVPRYWC
jgi:hypothetical protein